MAELLGSPMIRHVYENTVLNPLVDLTVVATCDEEIAEYVVSVGGRAVMTSNEHVRATDRCAEAVVIVEEEDGVRFDIVVMVQGDEPMTHPGMITEAVEPLLDDPSIPVTTLLGKISSIDELRDPNCIKVVCDQAGNALYFSRAPIAGAVKQWRCGHPRPRQVESPTCPCRRPGLPPGRERLIRSRPRRGCPSSKPATGRRSPFREAAIVRTYG